MTRRGDLPFRARDQVGFLLAGLTGATATAALTIGLLVTPWGWS